MACAAARRRVAGVVFAVLCLAGCAAEPPASPRLVVLYATCSLNKGFLAPYDASVAFTPRLAGFAKEAVVFERHRTESGQSGTAFASIFSAGQAPHHGVYHHPTRLSDALTLLAESFADAGFETHGWLEHIMASEQWNYAQGIAPENRHEGSLTGPDSPLPALLERLAADPDLRLFVITNFTVTHQPYRGANLPVFCAEHPELCEARGMPDFASLAKLNAAQHIRLSFDPPGAFRALGLSPERVARLDAVLRLLYRADVAQLDRMFGTLLDQIDAKGLGDQSVVAFTSDHGELPPRKGVRFRWTHGFQLAPEVLDVPWLIRAPGLAPGRYPAVTRSIDVAPTLLGLAGVASGGPPPDPSLRGVDLSPALRGVAEAPALSAFSHTALFPGAWWQRYGAWETVQSLHPDQTAAGMWVAVREQDRVQKLVGDGQGGWTSRVYDLATDPTEQTDRFDPRDAGQARTAARLLAYKRRLVEATGAAAATTPEQADALRALGYIE